MTCLRPFGRIAVCGAIAGYNDARPEPNKIHITNMIYNFQRTSDTIAWRNMIVDQHPVEPDDRL